ncbi:hypothetical protein M9458_000535 [Cirrhinus mrigala]|uniref:CCHC-type domain-containing protein n=1 Tax=Cirrhinus mrigala TaxID=683832 RepID=A0ABD0RVE7_CIRMR
MDPTPPDQSLTASQKTLPPSDPATAQASPSTDPTMVHQITSELSAQASTLLLHQQQLDRLTDLTGQLVRALQGWQLTPPPALTPVTTLPPGAQAAAASPRLTFPEKFDGSPEKCKGFLLQCSLFVSQEPHLYPTDECKIAFVCPLLSGRALEWATAIWRLDRPTFPSFSPFIQRFKEVFQPSAEDGEAGEQIMALRQGRRTAADYALSFRTLAAQSGWCDAPLKLHYRKGLHPDLQVELACRDEGLSLEEYIDLSIRVDNVMRARKASRPFTPVPLTTPSAAAAPEPMQVGATKLTSEERERRLRGSLCLYCGQPGHIRATCPTRPPRPPTSVSSFEITSNRCEIPVTLSSGNVTVETTALIDSGAAGNFIDTGFVTTNHLPVLSCAPHVTVAALDGRPLGSGKVLHTTDDITLRVEPSHQETIRLFVISSPQSPIILGYPWLNLHGPTIAWANRTITRWSLHCQGHCLQPRTRSETPLKNQITKNTIPTVYQDLLEAFSRQKATQRSRGGALSPTRSLWLPPTTVNGNLHGTFNAPHFPSPRTWDPHFRFRVLRVTSPLAAIYRPPGWRARLSILSVFPFVLLYRCRLDCLFLVYDLLPPAPTFRLDYRLLFGLSASSPFVVD